MAVVFEGAELVKFAIQLETNGYDFYRESSAKLTAAPSKALFDSLARQELEHKATFERLFENTGQPSIFETYPGEYDLYLKAYADSYVFTVKRMKDVLAKSRLDEKEAIQFGIDSEKESILYYTGIKEAVRQPDRSVIDRILVEERKHFVQLVRLLQDLG